MWFEPLKLRKTAEFLTTLNIKISVFYDVTFLKFRMQCLKYLRG
jgi:hypothetical protein